MTERKEMLQDDELEIDLKELFGTLLEHWILIVVTTLIAAVAGLLVTKLFITPQYRASVNMIVNSRQDLSGSLSNDNINSSKNLVPTYAVILKSNIILDEVIEELQLEDTYTKLNNRISVEAVNNTQVMKVSVEHPDPQIAYRIIENLVEIAPPVLVDSVEAGSCKVISKVTVGDNPVSPSTTKNTILAAMAGMVLSIGFIVLKSLLQNYIVDDEDIAKYLELPVLSVIPEVEED